MTARDGQYLLRFYVFAAFSMTTYSIAVFINDRLCLCCFQTTIFIKRLPQHKFDLCIDTTQFIVGPALHGVQDTCTNA